jgi:hypothetical protein
MRRKNALQNECAGLEKFSDFGFCHALPSIVKPVEAETAFSSI